MQICATELKVVMKRVLDKRKTIIKNHNSTTTAALTPHSLRRNSHSVPPDNQTETEGFSLETCRSMIALMDVSSLEP